FGAGSVEREVVPAREALDLLFERAGDGDHAVELTPVSGLEHERCFNDGDRFRIFGEDLTRPLFFGIDDGRVNDGVKFGDAPGGEGGIGKFGAVNGEVIVKDLFAEGSDNTVVDVVPELHQVAGDVVGEREVCAERDKHFSDSGFATRNAAR